MTRLRRRIKRWLYAHGFRPGVHSPFYSGTLEWIYAQAEATADRHEKENHA